MIGLVLVVFGFVSVVLGCEKALKGNLSVIDLNHFNHVDISDFYLFRHQEILAVIHKATEGFDYLDPYYMSREEPARKAGLLWGAFHFGRNEDGEKQAEWFLSQVKDPNNTLLALDIENPTKRDPGTRGHMSLADAEKFVNHVNNKIGRYPFVYGGDKFLEQLLNGNKSVLTKCKLWLSMYTCSPVIPKGWDYSVMWQYTNGTEGPEPRTVKAYHQYIDRNQVNTTIYKSINDFWLS